MSTPLTPMLRVRKDHTCRSLGPLGLDLIDMCDKCKKFQMRVDGLSGRRPSKLEMEKCEKSWFIPNGITKHTPYRLIKKKEKSIQILKKYNYRVLDDGCEKQSSSRLFYMSTNYRQNWTPEEAKSSHKTNTDLIHSSDEETGIKPPSILRDCDARIEKTNNDYANIPLPPPRPPKHPLDIDDLLSLLYPRKCKRVREIGTEWCENDSRKRHKSHVIVKQRL